MCYVLSHKHDFAFVVFAGVGSRKNICLQNMSVATFWVDRCVLICIFQYAIMFSADLFPTTICHSWQFLLLARGVFLFSVSLAWTLLLHSWQLPLQKIWRWRLTHFVHTYLQYLQDIPPRRRWRDWQDLYSPYADFGTAGPAKSVTICFCAHCVEDGKCSSTITSTCANRLDQIFSFQNRYVFWWMFVE